MKVHTEYLTFKTNERYEMVHITPEVEAIVRRSGVDDGLCFVSPMHITAAIYVNDNEDGLIEDIGVWLEKLAPRWPGYEHHRTGEDNADAHLKALLLHHETTLPVTKGRLDLGTWQRVFYAEFDGQRSKRVIVKVMGKGERVGGTVQARRDCVCCRMAAFPISPLRLDHAPVASSQLRLRCFSPQCCWPGADRVLRSRRQ